MASGNSGCWTKLVSECCINKFFQLKIIGNVTGNVADEIGGNFGSDITGAPQKFIGQMIHYARFLLYLQATYTFRLHVETQSHHKGHRPRAQHFSVHRIKSACRQMGCQSRNPQSRSWSSGAVTLSSDIIGISKIPLWNNRISTSDLEISTKKAKFKGRLKHA